MGKIRILMDEYRTTCKGKDFSGKKVNAKRHIASREYKGCVFNKALLKETEYYDCLFLNCMFVGAKITNVMFKDCRFVNCVLEESDMRDVVFTHCAFSKGTTMDGALISGTVTFNDCWYRDLSMKSLSIPGVLCKMDALGANLPRM